MSLDFSKDFLFGCATASYQVEGASFEDGRKPCIWDTFAAIPGKVFCGDDGKVSVDQYHRYKEDIELMDSLGIQAYRFSIAWPRIIPNGRGEVNPKGIAYYRNLCEELHKRGMKAYATIYHWDLPQSLQDEGGWTNRQIAYDYLEYAKVIFDNLSDVVDSWITINEPFCITWLSYLYGAHAPGYQDMNLATKAVHHVNLAHGLAMKYYREKGYKAPIGITVNPQTPRPATRKQCDIDAAKLSRALETEAFLGPYTGKGYPEILTKTYGITFPIQDGDMELISTKVDFFGVNYYNEYPVSASKSEPLGFEQQPFWERRTDIGWPCDCEGLLRQLKWLDKYTNHTPLYITENGSAEDDKLTLDNRVHDKERINYIYNHLKACSQAIKEGVDLRGYFVWSFIDNYEWTEGYSKRFGIVYADYKTLKRYPKDSAYFYRDVIAGYGEVDM